METVTSKTPGPTHTSQWSTSYGPVQVVVLYELVNAFSSHNASSKGELTYHMEATLSWCGRLPYTNCHNNQTIAINVRNLCYVSVCNSLRTYNIFYVIVSSVMHIHKECKYC